MAQNNTTFSDRVQRIEASRSGGSFRRLSGLRAKPGVVVHPDGFVQPFATRGKHLRFGFPIKGLIVASIVMILVKGYMMWTLGDDVYGAAVAQLLNGNQLERAAGLVLAPDRASNWVVDVYQHLYRVLVSLATALETGTFPKLA